MSMPSLELYTVFHPKIVVVYGRNYNRDGTIQPWKKAAIVELPALDCDEYLLRIETDEEEDK